MYVCPHFLKMNFSKPSFCAGSVFCLLQLTNTPKDKYNIPRILQYHGFIYDGLNTTCFIIA